MSERRKRVASVFSFFVYAGKWLGSSTEISAESIGQNSVLTLRSGKWYTFNVDLDESEWELLTDFPF